MCSKRIAHLEKPCFYAVDIVYIYKNLKSNVLSIFSFLLR